METDISKALTYQVKREIAERYFGYRKIIEEDKENLNTMLKDLRRFYEERVGVDFIRIYVLLKNRDLIRSFLDILGWPEGEIPFYDDYIVHSPTIKEKLLKGLEPHGWTYRGRLVNLLADCYKKLFDDIVSYQDRYEECLEEAKIINEEIRQFKENFSLDEILGFIGGLDRHDDLAGALGENIPVGHMQELAEKLIIEPVDTECIGPRPPILPPLKKIKGRLKELVAKAEETFTL